MLSAIRADPALASTRCIAISANAMPEEIEDALAAGFDDYLTKPLSAAALMAALQQVLPLTARASRNVLSTVNAESD